MRLPLFGEVWTKYQVAQLSRVLGTLLVGGIPLVQGTRNRGPLSGKPCLLKKVLDRTAVLVREGKPLSSSLASSGIVPPLGQLT